MGNIAQRRIARHQRKLATNTALLQKYLKTALPAGTALVGDMTGVVKAMRALGALRMPAIARANLRKRLVDSLPPILVKAKIRPADFGVDDIDTLAEAFIRTLERVRYHRYGVNELRRKKAGLKGVFAGELFELLVLNMTGIQTELQGLAAGQLEGLNRAMLSSRARLIDAKGVQYDGLGAWQGVHRVTDIVVYRGNQKLKFTDFAYVSYLTPTNGGKRAVSFLVEAEIKLPRAAAGFSEQMVVKQARFAGADRVEFTVANRKTPVHFTPDQIVFDRGNINRVALTTTSRPTESWRFRSTRSGGYADIYYRIGLVVDVEGVRSLVNELFR